LTLPKGHLLNELTPSSDVYERRQSLVIQTSFLGDMVLTTPLLSYLAQTDAVDVVGTPAAAVLLENHPAVRETIVYDKRGRDAGLAGFARLASRLRRTHYDRVLLAQGSMRSSALALATGARQRIGFDTSAGRALYTTKVSYIENEHHARRLLRLGGADGDLERPRLYPGAREAQAVDALLAGTRGPYMGLAPGSVWATKRWPSYDLLARELSRRATIVVIGSRDDHELAAEIANAAGGRAIDATGKLSLLASAELIRRCAVLITNDSAPQHLASAMNTPTITIFGPTVAQFGFGPLAERSATVGLDALACRPCDRHGPVACPLKHWKCMREVSVDRVVTAALGIADG
jgi:heptosyltransferase-2